MGVLVRFLDNKSGCWSRIDWESGEPAFISIAQSGILVKKSKLGILGTRLYEEHDIHNCVAMSRVLDDHILTEVSSNALPGELVSPILISLTRLAIEVKSAVEFCTMIGEAKKWVLKGN